MEYLDNFLNVAIGNSGKGAPKRTNNDMHNHMNE